MSVSSAAISFVSCPPAQAEPIARALVERRLAACVSVLPKLQSIYRWQGEIESAEESLLLIKHPAEGFFALRDAVLELHPYELPEIVAVNVGEAHTPYLDWILASCR
ncbi:divalent-cation tolerance protein CutA [Solimonas marina]|uniref:Divalent-cation tolerance protein CutA n=1 Tax=Solimonas marina TaxID=2714601 RepID=A0A969W6S0_9GAMM|nr:divalent-cation tolerance protein CutA [Solimonas marina]NKF21632.1 divalent-cation tolerance protein CutA [Solimonas marina]